MIGKQTWVFADGDLPPHPEHVDEPIAHEALMVVNAGTDEAVLDIELLFEEAEPVEGLQLRVPPRSVKCFRMDQAIWGSEYRIPSGQYALIVQSNRPIVAVFGRLDRREDMAYYSVAPYAQ